MLRVDARGLSEKEREEEMDGDGGSKCLGILFLHPYWSLQSTSLNVPTRRRVLWIWTDDSL